MSDNPDDPLSVNPDDFFTFEESEVRVTDAPTEAQDAILANVIAVLEGEDVRTQAEADDYKATANQPADGETAATFYQQLRKLMAPQAMPSNAGDATASLDGAKILSPTRYPKIAYSDKVSSFPPEDPEQDVALPGGNLIRYAEDAPGASSAARIENDNPVFILDTRVFVQGVEISDHMIGELRYTANNTAGSCEASFTVENSDNKFMWTERNLASIYGRSAIRARAPYVQEFVRKNKDAIEARAAIARNSDLPTEISGPEEQEQVDLYADEAAIYHELIDNAFKHTEDVKEAIFRYKGDRSRNPPIRNPKNAITHARFDLVPNKPIFNRMDPVRVFVLYPWRVPGKGYEEGKRKELWVPAFTGYVNGPSVDDDYIEGKSTVTITCSGFKQSVLARMRTSNDLTSGLANPLDAMGFRTNPSYVAGKTPQDEAFTDQVKKNTDGYFDINNTLFYDDIIVNEFNQPFPNMPLEQAVRELLVAKNPITAESTNRGVRGVEFGGNFYYDTDFSRSEAQDFLESWHKFCLFGPKRRPWTRDEMQLVGEGTTTDGEYAPNNNRLWFMLPKSGTGPGNLADLSQVSVQLSHDVNWTNRLEIITNFVEALDYNWIVTPCGDMICEFSFADFKPEDFGEFSQTFRVDKASIAGQQAPEQEVPPSGLIVTTGFAAGATVQNEVAQASLTKVFVYSPYIAARYGISHATESLPFLTARDKGTAQQRAVMLYQRRIARCHAMNLQFVYRPFMLPNRPNHHVQRTMMGNIVTNETTIQLGDNNQATSQVGYEHVRYFTGYYRDQEDLEGLNTFQTNQLVVSLDDPNDLQALLGLDLGSNTNPEEMRIYTTVAAGESLPATNRFGWSSESVLAAASGIYVLDVDKLREDTYKTPVNNTAHDEEEDSDTTVEDPPEEEAVREEDPFKFARDPVRFVTVTSKFGPRTHPKTGEPSKQHDGVDLQASIGTDVFAVDDGVIVKAGSQKQPASPYSGKDSVPGTGGNILLLKTDQGLYCQYLHLDASSRGLVSIGQKVTAGQVIAKTGNTGRSTGPHLHFEVKTTALAVKNKRAKVAGIKVDPLQYFPSWD